MRPFWGISLLFLILPGPMWADAAFRFDPKAPMVDEVVNVRITGLTAGSVVTIRGRAHWFGKAWQGVATFQADDQGAVDLGKQAPLKGTYSGVDAMGLFWSM